MAAIDPAAQPDNPAMEIPPVDLYRMAVEEYRWQAQFNWSRTQYLLAFNAVILAAAVGLTANPGRGPALVFVLGALASALTQIVVRTQHGYYRAARDRMRRIEASLDIPAEYRIDSTSTLGGRKRKVSVNQVVALLLWSLVVADLIGAVVVFTA